MEQLLAVAILGDVTVDLPHPRSSPQVVDVDAFAVVRDAEVLVAEGTMVQMFRGFRASERAPWCLAPLQNQQHPVVRMHAHTVLGSVTEGIA